MLSTEQLFDYVMYAVILGYAVVVVRYLSRKTELTASNWIGVAILCWPFFMFDEWLRLGNVPQLAHLYGFYDVFAVLLLTCCYRAIKSMLIRAPSRRLRLWWPLLLTVTAQIGVYFLPVEDKVQWLSVSPSGEPLRYWPLYLSSLLTGFSVLLLGIFITEHLQLYHRHLPEQVVDVKEFKVTKLASVMGLIVGLAFMSILLVTAVTFGFFSVGFWEQLHHVVLGIPLLLFLFCLTIKRSTSPSPLDYDRMDNVDLSPAQMRSAVAKAEKVMIDSKAYKQIGMTLELFSKQSGIEPTTLAIALQMQLKKNFRSFVYFYRLEYAKKVLLRTDTKIASVAKRLGLNSEKFLSDVLVKHLRNNPTM